MIDHTAADNETGRIGLKDDSNGDEGSMGLIAILIALAKRKKTILGAAFVAGAISAGVSMMLPSIYGASVRLLPPQQGQSSAAMMLSQLGGLAGVAAGAAGLKNPADIYVAMLKSRTVADRMVDHFSLQNHYETQSREKTRGRLEANTSIVAGKDGLITVQVEDKDQRLVAALANGYVDELLRLTKTLAVTEAAQRRLFFEQELERSKNNLVKAEIALKRAIDEHGVISVDTEGRAQLEMIARLRAQISAKEIAFDSMKAFVTSNHPEYRRTEEALSSLRAELSRLENGRHNTGSNDSGAGAVSSNGIMNIQLLRDVKYYETLFELLAKQYEAARLDEAKDPSVIQVLDPAITPERRFKPKRVLIVLISMFLTAMASVAVVLFSEAKSRWLLSPGAPERWSELKSNLRFK
jgi:tyrosine-protein kinase Etk/Wzc